MNHMTYRYLSPNVRLVETENIVSGYTESQQSEEKRCQDCGCWFPLDEAPHGICEECFKQYEEEEEDLSNNRFKAANK